MTTSKLEKISSKVSAPFTQHTETANQRETKVKVGTESLANFIGPVAKGETSNDSKRIIRSRLMISRYLCGIQAKFHHRRRCLGRRSRIRRACWGLIIRNGRGCSIKARINLTTFLVLFQLQVSSFWSMKLGWMIFFSCMLSTFTADLLNSSFNSFR